MVARGSALLHCCLFFGYLYNFHKLISTINLWPRQTVFSKSACDILDCCSCKITSSTIFLSQQICTPSSWKLCSLEQCFSQCAALQQVLDILKYFSLHLCPSVGHSTKIFLRTDTVHLVLYLYLFLKAIFILKLRKSTSKIAFSLLEKLLSRLILICFFLDAIFALYVLYCYMSDSAQYFSNFITQLLKPFCDPVS